MRPPTPGLLLAGAGLAWLSGAALQLRQSALLPRDAYLLALGAAACALAAAILLRRRAPWAAALAAIAAAALAAFGATGGQASLRLADALPPALEGRDLRLTGVVAGLPQSGEAGWRFRFEVEQALQDGAAVPVPRSVSLGWYLGAHEDAALRAPGVALRAGQRWELSVRLRRPHGNANPQGFDVELYLFEQGLRATGYVRDAPPPRLLDEAAGYGVARLRQRVRDAIALQVEDPRAAGILAALAVGDQAAIARGDWEVLRATGVAHLMAISGLHVTMFAWLAGLALGWAWRRSARAMLWLPAPAAARWGGVAAAAAYAVFAGWGVPAQRTVLMLVVVALLHSLGRRWPWPIVMVAAAFAVTLADPWALLQPGFWLSFAAVGLLMAADGAAAEIAPRRGRLHGALRAALRTQAVATAGLAPLTLIFFGQVSLVGFAANLVAIPIVTLIVTPLALLGAGAAPLWQAAAWITQLLLGALDALARLPAAVWSAPAAPPWAQAAALLGAALLVLPLPWRLRAMALPLLVALLLPPRDLPAEGEFAVIAADVGQGTAVLVRTRSHLLLYDAGPLYGPASDAGQRVLLPLLRARGETRIDLLLLSHRDSDHVGGAQALLAALPVAALLGSLDAEHPLVAARADSFRRCEAGQRWAWDGVEFEILAPAAGSAAPRPNALSCVLRVQGRGASLLLAGDIEAAQERELVVRQSGALRADWLIVPHHGSRGSSSAELLDAVQPKVAIAQAGYRNRFGHPADEVRQRYRERGIELRVSADCGAWLATSGGAPGGQCWRELARRYWHYPEAEPGGR